MKSTTDPQDRLAVLIDADNTSPQIVEPLAAEIAKYGVASVKRIYGDWTKPSLRGWKDVLLAYAIHPVQQFRYTVGKNATDSTMIIDAMDLLYTDNFDGFCIVSSDSDFTRLASRIRETGTRVYGFGKKTTPEAFVSACDRFIYTEILKAGSEDDAEDDAEDDDGEEGAEEPQKTGAASARVAREALRRDAKLVGILREAIGAVAGDDGWATLSTVGMKISNQYPSFDSRNYGYTKLSALVAAIDLFHVEERQVGDNPANRAIFMKQKVRRRRR